ncbi:MAG TPA: HD domain-containing phosphohydrolase, partial [Pyrinomonadaceae bacterium]
YPHGLRGEQIDLNARIFAVADAFDAITSDRVYRRGRTYEAAVDELTRCAGTHFDPRVVEAFMRVPRRDWGGMRRGLKASAPAAAHPEPRRLPTRPTPQGDAPPPDILRRCAGASRADSR